MDHRLPSAFSFAVLIGLIPTAVFFAVLPLNAAEDDPLPVMLSREIVGQVLPLAEVQRYCEARVPAMPPLTTAAAWQSEAARLRAAVLEKIVFRGQAVRWRDAPAKVEWLDTIAGGPGYRIKKLRFEALPGMWIPALLYEPEKLDGKVPAILNVNGHVGPVGKAYVPKQHRCINQAKRGMLALNVEWLGMGQLSAPGYAHARMHQLDLCGTSGLAPFYLSMQRALDLLLALEHTDPQRVAVTGLSGGGWQTIVLSALDTRVTMANPVAGYSSYRTRAAHLKDLGEAEQTPTDLATIVDYTHLTAMMAPHPTLLTYNSKDDCCFESGYALGPLWDAALPAFRLFGKDSALRKHVNENPGTHNYEQENREAFYALLGDFFYSGDKDFRRAEIPSDKEIKQPKELDVALPPHNADFHSLALDLAKNLPVGWDKPSAVPPPANERARSGRSSDRTTAAGSGDPRRAALRNLLRMKDFKVTALPPDREEKEGVKAAFRRFQMDGDWTVPAVELARGKPKATAILVADGGRASVRDEAARLLKDGVRVLAVDPFYFGESRIAKSDYLFAILVACVGDRPLGIQAGQVAAIARWAADEYKSGPVTVVAVGPRSGTFVLAAAALEEKAIGRVELIGSLGSLKEVLTQDWPGERAPEMFCFGLLERFDIPQLTALVSPRPVISRK